MDLLPPIHTLFVQIMLCYVFWTFIVLILLFCCVENACRYGFDVTKAPFSSMVLDASSSLFKSGKACGIPHALPDLNWELLASNYSPKKLLRTPFHLA